jgi:hypothetical protein
MRTAPVGSVSDHRAENGTTKCPESLCRRSALPPSGRRVPPPAGTLLPGHGSYRLIRRSRSALLSFGLSLVRGVSAGCYQPLLPAGPSRRYLCESFPGCLGPCHGGPAECICLFPPPRHRPSPVHYRGRLPACTRQHDFTTDRFFGTAAIPLCSGPQACSPPRSFLPLRLIVAEQPRLLTPSRTCFVTSACIGDANHLPRQLVVWGLTPHQIRSLVGCSSVVAISSCHLRGREGRNRRKTLMPRVLNGITTWVRKRRSS